MNCAVSKSKITWSSESSIKELLRRTLNLFRPPERVKCSEWAERHRRLSLGVSAKGGKFSFAPAPWQREVLDVQHDESVRELVLMWASQATGKTETLNNIVGFTIDIDPCPILVLQPDLVLADAWSKDRLSAMLRDTPRLRGKVRDPRTRDSGNTIKHKKFPGGHITIVTANSPAGLAGRPIRKVICDEIDRYPASAGTEGDPIALAEKRTESFSDAFVVKVSSPTIKGVSKIEAAFEQSDKRYYFCPCPKCGHFQTLKWSQIDFSDKGTKEDPRYICESESCKAPLVEYQRRQMISDKRSEWRATAKFSGVRGYHLNGIYTLFPHHRGYRSRLQEMVSQFLKAKAEGDEKEKVWVNTFLAETWEVKGEKPESSSLLGRREEYGPEVPADVLVLTASVDVQGDRVEAQVKGHGLGEESWGVQFRRIMGNPHKPEVWEKLDAFYNQKFEHPSGLKLGIAIMGIDTGGHKSNFAFSIPVYRFVKKHQQQASRGIGGVVALKGSSIRGAPVAVQRLQKNGINLLMVGTDTAKMTVYERLKIAEHGPRFMHYPQPFTRMVGNSRELVDLGFADEYFFQLTSEELRTTYHRGFQVKTWHKTRARNEALDLEAYDIALFELLNPNMKVIAAQFPKPKAKPEEQPKQEPSAKPEHAKPRQFRLRRF